MKNLSVVEYQKSDLSLFQKYIKKAFHEKYILNDQKYIDWQFDKLYVIKTGDKSDGEIISHYGYKDWDYKIYDKSVPVRLPMNLYVLADYRAFGIGTLISKIVFDTKNPALISGYSEAMFKLATHLRKGWRSYGNLKRFISVLDSSAPLFGAFKIPKVWEFQVDKSNIVVEKVDGANISWGELWQEVREKYPVTVERTQKYLDWRFANNPFIKYNFFEAKNAGKLVGYLICRTEEDSGFKIARIIDFISTDEAEMPLLYNFLHWAKKDGAAASDFMFSGNLYERSLVGAGFFDTKDTDFAKFPLLFGPISHTRFSINVCGDMPVKDGDYYFTKADSDQDRTNPH